MRIVDKRGQTVPQPAVGESEQLEQAPELSGKPSEVTVGELQRQELASAAAAKAINSPEVGRKFYIDDVQFQIVDVRLEGLLIVPVGISPQAMKKVRRAMRNAK